MARIRAVQDKTVAEQRNFWQRLVSLEWRFAATAALVVAGLLTYDAQLTRTSQSEIWAAQQAEPRDLFSPNRPLVPVSRDDVLIMIAESNHGNN
jgi:hypothetical protein